MSSIDILFEENDSYYYSSSHLKEEKTKIHIENQAKIIVIEYLQMLNFLIYIYTVKGISLTLRFAILQMTPEEVEIQQQKEYIYFTR